MKELKYQTTDKYFDSLNFHDTLFDGFESSPDSLIIDFEFIYVSENHPLNPHATAKSTGHCRLTFNNVQSVTAESHMPTNPQPISEYLENPQVTEIEIRPSNLNDLKGMEILTVEKEEAPDGFTFKFWASNLKGFADGVLIVRAPGFTLGWNEFLEDAWYVNWKEYWEE